MDSVIVRCVDGSRSGVPWRMRNCGRRGDNDDLQKDTRMDSWPCFDDPMGFLFKGGGR